MNVLIVEDEAVIAKSIKQVVQRIPHVNLIEIAHSFSDGFHKACSNTFDIILIDIFLGKESLTGIDLCHSIRKNNQTVPLIIITVSHATKTLEKAFAEGVNDYLTKPFRPKELEVRVKRWLSLRERIERREKIEHKKLVYSFRENEFYYHERKLILSKKKKLLLRLLLEEPEKVLSQQYLREKLWGDFNTLENDHNIRSSIYTLRKTLPKILRNWICNQRGEGYMLRS